MINEDLQHILNGGSLNIPNKYRRVRQPRYVVQQQRTEVQNQVQPQENVIQQNYFPVPAINEPITDPSLISQPAYDDNAIQILNDTAADDSEPAVHGFLTYSEMGDRMKKRIDVRASAFLSKNHVFSNIVDNRDYLMAQDDFQYVKILSEADTTSMDLTSDYFTADAIIEANHNIRLRRSRKALNLSMFNTVRQESMFAGAQPLDENRKIWQKIPFLGNRGGNNNNGQYQ
jgi:hypothetical protein